MSARPSAATAWLYGGVWGVLARWFRVPATAPATPAGAAGQVRAFRPAPGFLSYLKLWFWLALVLVDAAVVTGWLVAWAAAPVAGIALAPVALFVVVVLAPCAYVAVHLRYDTTWYVLTDRSLRIRRGVWTIHETTITFENVQNVTVSSGPVERLFGIANVVVETAGADVSRGSHGESISKARQGRLEGVDDAEGIRDLILGQVRRSRSAGLGDEPAARAWWGAAHLAVLREIRDALAHGA